MRCPNKKGAGRINHSPRMDSRFAMSDHSLWLPTDNKRLRREDLTSFGTAAGQNLAAVGSSHSLPETVDLGSVTTAGLVGTLHTGYTSCQFQMLDSRKTGRSET